MNKTELIATVAEKLGLTKKAANEVVDAFLNSIEEALVKGETVVFLGFGTFSTAKTKARIARVPGTNRTVEVAASTAVKFKVGKALKDSVASAK